MVKRFILVRRWSKQIRGDSVGPLGGRIEHALVLCGREWKVGSNPSKMYVYALSQPARGVYVFDSVLEFNISCASRMLALFLPKIPESYLILIIY